MLSLRVPDILPDIDPHTATDRQLAERSELIGYGVDGIARDESALIALLTILGTFGPSSTEANLRLIKTRE